MGALPCPSRLASRPTTTSCWTSTAASGWATSRRRARSRPSARCARPARRLAFVTNDARHGEDDFVRKLWRLGFQAVARGGRHRRRRAAARARRAPGTRRRSSIGSAAVHRHVTDAGLRILNGSDLADRADVVVVSGHDALRLRRAARRGPGRRCAAPSSWCTAATRPSRCPTARGRRRARSSPRSRPPPARGAHRGQARAPAVPHRARPARARAARSSSAIASTPTWPARAPPGSTGRSSSPAPRRAAMARAADPAPAFVAASLAELVLAP